MMNKPFGPMLRNFRIQRGLSQAELGLRCRIARGRVSMLETGRRRPTYAELELLTRELPEAEALLKQAARLSPEKAGRPRSPLSEELRRLIPPPPLFVPRGRVPTRGLLGVLRRNHPELYRHLWDRLRRRRDFPAVERHLDRTACDSCYELAFFMHSLADNGGICHWSLSRLGFTRLPAVDPDSPVMDVVSGRPMPGYVARRGSDRSVLVPHATLWTPARPYTVDAFGTVVHAGRVVPFIAEVDGSGHDDTYDRERRLHLKLPEVRFTEAELVRLDFMDTFWEKVSRNVLEPAENWTP